MKIVEQHSINEVKRNNKKVDIDIHINNALKEQEKNKVEEKDKITHGIVNLVIKSNSEIEVNDDHDDHDELDESFDDEDFD